MAEDTSSTAGGGTATEPDEQATQQPDELRDPGKKALQEERQKARAAERDLKAAQARLKELEDRDKSEAEKTAERLADAEKRAEQAELRAMRLEVAAEKGLTPAQAKRLVGASREELEADADDILATFPAAPVAPERKAPKPDPSQGSRGGAKPSASDRANSRLERLGIRKPSTT